MQNQNKSNSYKKFLFSFSKFEIIQETEGILSGSGLEYFIEFWLEKWNLDLDTESYCIVSKHCLLEKNRFSKSK